MIANGTEANSAYAPVGPEQVRGHRGTVPEAEREQLAAGFGAEVRRLRKAAGLSQIQTGDLAGLRGDHVGRLERGQRRPSVAAIKALARVMVPAEDREAAEQRLAALAGGSLREGAERRKQARNNRHRRQALADMEKSAAKIRRAVQQMELSGRPVPGSLRKVADSATGTVERLRAEVLADRDPESIAGYTPADAVPEYPRRRKENYWRYTKRVAAQQRAEMKSNHN